METVSFIVWIGMSFIAGVFVGIGLVLSMKKYIDWSDKKLAEASSKHTDSMVDVDFLGDDIGSRMTGYRLKTNISENINPYINKVIWRENYYENGKIVKTKIISNKSLYDRIFTPIIRWFPDFNNSDKVVHAIIGFMASYLTSFLSRIFGYGNISHIVGFSASVAVGIAKEVLDYQRSKKIKPENAFDFLATIFGGGVASGLTYLIINQHQEIQ